MSLAMSNLLNIAIGSLLTKARRMSYICSKHSIFLFTKKSRDHFFSLSEAEQIQIFGKFFDYYWFLYIKKGRKIDFLLFDIAKFISLGLVCCSFTQPVCFFSLPPSRKIWLRKRYLFAGNNLLHRKNRAYLWQKNG